MKITADGTDVSNLIGSVTWSGDVKQMARKLSFDYLYTDLSADIQIVEIGNGSRIIAYDDNGNNLFDGIVISEEFDEADIKKSIQAADYAFYLKNKVYGEFKGTPEQVVKEVVAMFGITVGTLPSVAGEISILAAGDKTIYQIIEDAYSSIEAGVYIRMDGMILNIEEIGSVICGTLTGDDYVTSAKYKSSIENVVNQVAIIDGSSKLMDVRMNTQDMQYGVIQEVYKHDSSDKNPIEEAEKLFKSMENSGSLAIKGDYSIVAGRAVIVEKVNSKIQGLFKVTSDSHSISNGQHTATITLDFTEVV